MTAGPARRGLLLAVAGSGTAAAVLWLTAGQTWLQLTLVRNPPLPPVSETFSGADLIAPLVPIGILGGASALALLATGRVGRSIVGVVLILAGALILLRASFFVAEGGMTNAFTWVQQFEEGGLSLHADREASRAPAVFALLGGGMLVTVGVFTVVRARGWPVMGTRFERRSRPGARTDLSGPESHLAAGPTGASAPVTEAAMWAAIERGEDPTSNSAPSHPADAEQPTRDQTVTRPSLQ
ncbi:MAG: Trp biosynthesis-associated membrane protein [Actinomycetota bacterium]|nr:Trp biosynthesis-associated membrane protein [Actinomycetota bacterium]